MSQIPPGSGDPAGYRMLPIDSLLPDHGDRRRPVGRWLRTARLEVTVAPFADADRHSRIVFFVEATFHRFALGRELPSHWRCELCGREYELLRDLHIGLEGKWSGLPVCVSDGPPCPAYGFAMFVPYTWRLLPPDGFPG